MVRSPRSLMGIFFLYLPSLEIKNKQAATFSNFQSRGRICRVTMTPSAWYLIQNTTLLILTPSEATILDSNKSHYNFFLEVPILIVVDNIFKFHIYVFVKVVIAHLLLLPAVLYADMFCERETSQKLTQFCFEIFGSHLLIKIILNKTRYI